MNPSGHRRGAVFASAWRRNHRIEQRQRDRRAHAAQHRAARQMFLVMNMVLLLYSVASRLIVSRRIARGAAQC